MLNFLLAQDEIVVNTRNFMGETPLFLAVKYVNYEAAKCLIKAGANVNLPNFEDLTPLHIAVNYPISARLLLENGANVHARDYSEDTPLHDAVTESSLEVVWMLLYYNADANSVGGNGLTPFMKALITDNVEIQSVLIEYVSDFNTKTFCNMSTLALAVTHDTPYVQAILDGGADITADVFCKCIGVPNVKNFKLIWDRLAFNEDEPICLMEIFNLNYLIEQYIDIIIDSPNTKLLDERILPSYTNFVSKYVEAGIVCLDKLTKITCLLLQNSYRIPAMGIYMVFVSYGYCELIKILQFMDHDNIWHSYALTPRLIFDVHSKVEAVAKEIPKSGSPPLDLKIDLLCNFSYFAVKPLVEFYLKNFGDDHTGIKEELAVLHSLPKVPSLVELARNKTREFIVKKFEFQNSCQYYTFVGHLDIPLVYRKILTFEKKLY